ncbi:hypothetical protein JYT59_00095 [Sphingobacteriaceae bacterium AH-315-L07]|nr:hypothetical protein [Sphingobacteriaceae bacterium AH-315-L07]
MSAKFKKFLIVITAVSLVYIAAVWFVLNDVYNMGQMFLPLSIIIFLFYLSSVGSSSFLFRANKKRPQDLIRASMGVTTIKFFINIGILIVFIMLNKANMKMIIAVFFITYVIYTILEKVLVINGLQKKES